MNLIGFLGFFVLFNYTANSSLLDPVIENVRHIKATHPPDQVSGMWKKKMLWKPRWIKEWKSSNVIKPVWRKFWGPVIIREWIPIPKPPPQWDTLRINSPEYSISDVSDPPTSNFNYLQKNPLSYKPPKETRHSFSISGEFPGRDQINYKAPHLPITTGYKSQSETYSGQTSYGDHIDNSAYDLNPPVEQFNPKYVYDSNHLQTQHISISSIPIKSASSHIHHHHHHMKSNSDSYHIPDLTKFPPNWNSWELTHSKPHSSGLAQASSPISIVSQVQSTTEKLHKAVDDHLLSQGLLPSENDFIQEAALVSEYHYTENPLKESLSSSFINPSVIPLIPDFSQSINQNYSIYPNNSNHILPLRQNPIQHLNQSFSPNTQIPNIPKQSSLPATIQTQTIHYKSMPAHSHNSQTASHHSKSSISTLSNQAKNPSSGFHHTPNLIQPHKSISILPVNNLIHTSSSSSSVTSTQNNLAKIHSKSSPNKQNPIHPRIPASILSQTPNLSPKSLPPKKSIQPKPELVKNQKPHFIKSQIHKVPDFKALPSTSIEAFHFIEGFPSNQTFTKAALIKNINHSGVKENQLEIIAAKPNQKEIPAYVTKLAQAIVTNHLKKAEENNSNITEITTTSEASTEKETITVVYPSTNAFIRKTLKAYLTDEKNEEKSTKVFVVTPVPQEKIESSQEDGNKV